LLRDASTPVLNVRVTGVAVSTLIGVSRREFLVRTA